MQIIDHLLNRINLDLSLVLPLATNQWVVVDLIMEEVAVDVVEEVDVEVVEAEEGVEAADLVASNYSNMLIIHYILL